MPKPESKKKPVSQEEINNLGDNFRNLSTVFKSAKKPQIEKRILNVPFVKEKINEWKCEAEMNDIFKKFPSSLSLANTPPPATLAAGVDENRDEDIVNQHGSFLK